MCGIVGLLSFQSEANAREDFIVRASQMMRRRGPDDESFWKDGEGRLCLGFRRLAILALAICTQSIISSVGQSGRRADSYLSWVDVYCTAS